MVLELIVDANVLFSALLAKSTTRKLLFSPHLKLSAPEYLITELEKHLESDSELREKLNQTKEETEVVIHELLHNIETIPAVEYRQLIGQALKISPDEFDAPYFALALHLKLPIWSNDKRLKKQKMVQVHNTWEILEKLKGSGYHEI